MKTKNQNFINNFIREKTEKVYKRNIKEVTDFLDPSEAEICEDYLKKNKSKVNYSFYGGFPEAERKRLCIYPLDEKVSIEDFSLLIIEGKTSKNLKEISHRDILGALMSTGIKREKTGDILLIPQGGAILVDMGMASYLSDNFPVIKGATFFTNTFKTEDYNFPEVETKEKILNISSWRLDGFVSKAYNLSRNDAQSFIRSGKVKVNHKENLKTDFVLSEEDVISVRTKGRFVIKEELGKTKKENFRVLVTIY